MPPFEMSTMCIVSLYLKRVSSDITCCNPFFRYRFAEMRYQRPAEHHHGRLVPARIETVVIFLPDVWSCCPTQLEWENIHVAYKKQLRLRLGPETAADHNQALNAVPMYC